MTEPRTLAAYLVQIDDENLNFNMPRPSTGQKMQQPYFLPTRKRLVLVGSH
jgi:hypothetical protein